MPNYEYRCPHCGSVEVRNVPVAQMDNQYCTECRCECGEPVQLEKQFPLDANIIIPENFKAVND